MKPFPHPLTVTVPGAAGKLPGEGRPVLLQSLLGRAARIPAGRVRWETVESSLCFSWKRNLFRQVAVLFPVRPEKADALPDIRDAADVRSPSRNERTVSCLAVSGPRRQAVLSALGSLSVSCTPTWS